jgi:hypothetical protein
MKKTLLVKLILGVFVCGANAQTVTTPQPMQNLYGAGLSYSIGGSPSIAGTGLYAHVLTNNAGALNTYAFTAVDALPNTLKPFTVNTNVGIGVAQQIAVIHNVPIYVPTSAGVSFSGTNTGWEWNSGFIASIHLKGSSYLLPSVRFLKSSVTNGTGYQPIIGLLYGWGK